jgi:hypothetical protein
MRGVITLMELVLSADHATTIGYRREGNEVVPVFKNDPNVQRMMEWGLPTMARAVELVAEEFPLENAMVDANADLRAPVFRALEMFWKSPTRSEASLLACFPFEDGWGNESETIAISAPLKSCDAIAALLNRKSKMKFARHHWRAGSAALSSPLMRWVSNAELFSRTVRRRHLVKLARNTRKALRSFADDVKFG